jgi:hypothetical protein
MTMTRRLLAVIACLGAAACGGGGGGNAANPAASRTFTYGGTATPAPPGAAEAASAALLDAASFDAGAGPDATGVTGALFAAADAALGGSATTFVAPADPLPALRRARARALALAGPIGEGLGPDPAFPRGCYVVSGSTVTFSRCTMTEVTEEGSVRVTLDGTVSGAPGSVAWDLTIGALVSMSSAEGAFTANLGYDDAGTFAVTATTAKAHQEAALAITVEGDGQTARVRVAQAADLDTTIAPADVCSTRITGGTFEAKRVWSEVPAEARDEPEFRDRGVKLTWTGCGTANALFSAQ